VCSGSHSFYLGSFAWRELEAIERAHWAGAPQSGNHSGQWWGNSSRHSLALRTSVKPASREAAASNLQPLSTIACVRYLTLHRVSTCQPAARAFQMQL